MNKYKYKPILSKDQIAQYKRYQKWVLGVFLVLAIAIGAVIAWESRFNSKDELSDSATVAFYLGLTLFGFFLLGFRFIPDCQPIFPKQKSQLLGWRDEFPEVDERVLAIFSERDYIIQYEFVEIQKRAAVLSKEVPNTDPTAETENSVTGSEPAKREPEKKLPE